MVVVDENGDSIDWPLSLGDNDAANLARWRSYIGTKLNIPAGQLRAIRWNDAGGLEIVVIRKDRTGPA